MSSTTNAGERSVAAFIVILAIVLVILIALSLLPGCAILTKMQDRVTLENQRREAVNDVIAAEANLLAGCVEKVPRSCVWPAVWPVNILITFKKGEPSLVSLPTLPELIVP